MMGDAPFPKKIGTSSRGLVRAVVWKFSVKFRFSFFLRTFVSLCAEFPSVSETYVMGKARPWTEGEDSVLREVVSQQGRQAGTPTQSKAWKSLTGK